MIWKDVLISRLALKVFNLLEDDKLVINLRFVVTGRDLKRAIDGVSEMSRDLSRLLESGAQSDIDLVTRDGVRLPVHSAILAVRSNLLQRAAKKGRVSAASTPRAQAETPPVKHVDTPINSTFGSMSSGPGPASPRSSPSSSKVSRRPPTPKRVALSQRPPTPRRNLSSRHLTPARSPSKRPLTPAAESPSKRTNVGRASIKFSEENKENKSLKIFHYRPRPSPSTCPGDSPGRATEAGEAPAGGKGPERLQVEVSMTASVATELLHWIYTGESDDLGALARPLLVAGIRHGMGGLTRACEDHLAAALTPASAPDVLYLAHKYGATSLREDALEYAVRKASEVTAQASWEALGERAPTLIMEFSRRLALHDHALTANA
ncbi:putative speckle-type POZ protein-like [Penaeus vannamei]|uniref:Putative speckle-type POZ protein-like n=1 Tax=Penaeus vannamei TaxID=6689 RepID=A0A3R7SNN2_PENVA|nr:putative speckle-type POZ protein-like [Penaeus vannamei]